MFEESKTYTAKIIILIKPEFYENVHHTAYDNWVNVNLVIINSSI
jgi:hypothetical protein